MTRPQAEWLAAIGVFFALMVGIVVLLVWWVG
jgi:hypothetical protein